MARNLDIYRRQTWNPIREFSRMLNQLSSFDNDLFLSNPTSLSDLSIMPGTLVPRYEIQDTDTHHLIAVEMPGIPQENIQVEMNGDRLTITGESEEMDHSEGGKKSKNKTRSQSYRRFQQSFVIPDIDPNNPQVEANYINGVLELAIPRAQEKVEQPKRIEVKGEKKGLLSRLLGSVTEKKDESQHAPTSTEKGKAA